MALKHTLLGLIIRKPGSGYSLHRRFFKTVRLKISQVYRALNEMSSEGLIFSERVEHNKRPAQNVFYATEAGRAELKRWLSEHSAIKPMRAEIAQRLWFASLGRTEDIIAFLESFIDGRQAELKYYRQTGRKLQQRDLKEFGNTLDKMLWDAVFDYFRKRGEAEVAWAKSLIKDVSKSGQKIPQE